MRHVSKAEVKKVLPKAWGTKAKAALKELEKLKGEKRKAYIKKNPQWQSLRPALAGVRGGKCWYCESIIKRSPTPIDHFRPKARVIEDKRHPGYWWLAYEWTNYRFVCTHCNTFGTAQKRGRAGGKNDHFPLCNPSKRATGPRVNATAPDPVAAELPVLLDPLQDSDPALLWFDENGTVTVHPNLCANKKGANFKRADESIKTYGLFQDELNARRGIHLKGIVEILEEADELNLDVETNRDTTAKHS